MKFDTLDKLPSRIQVDELVTSRYGEQPRPESWDRRRDGVDVVRTSDGRVLKLQCDGMQSPPQKGWVLMVRDGDAEHGYRWTLYGMPRQTGH
ncbi:MAG: hypothetical protein K1X83_11435 [Oligoflexia bacterium]|nr:hypothetical protein [Oligoflexia bacterium]